MLVGMSAPAPDSPLPPAPVVLLTCGDPAGIGPAIVAAAWRALRSGCRTGRRVGSCILALLALQIALGVTNVLQGLPLPVAVLHNGVAALLVGSLVTLLYFSTRAPRAQG